MHSVDVRCEVDADPAESIRFSWTYNNTRNVSPVNYKHLFNRALSFGHTPFSLSFPVSLFLSLSLSLSIDPSFRQAIELSRFFKNASVDKYALNITLRYIYVLMSLCACALVCLFARTAVKSMRYSSKHTKFQFSDKQVLNSRITSNGLVSTMTYLAPSDSELTLACWASNVIGRQKMPCLIHIIPASKYHLWTVHISSRYKSNIMHVQSTSSMLLPSLTILMLNARELVYFEVPSLNKWN